MTLMLSEEEEQKLVVQYCNLRNIPRFRVPNETYTKSWNQKRKNKELGVSSGVPDLFCIVGGKLIAIEMKRTKGSVTSPTQIEWIKRLNDVGITTRICKGHEEAINFIKELEV